MQVPKQVRVLLVLIAAMILPGCTLVVRHPGPPEHVPARVHYDYYYDYYYYPSAQVYFHVYTGYYYYYSGRRWVRTRVLPRHIHLHPRDRYKFKYRNGQPYKRHDFYRKKYRPRPGLRFDRKQDNVERELLRKRYGEYRRRGDDRYRDNGRHRPEFRRPDDDDRGSGNGDRRERSDSRHRYDNDRHDDRKSFRKFNKEEKSGDRGRYRKDRDEGKGKGKGRDRDREEKEDDDRRDRKDERFR